MKITSKLTEAKTALTERLQHQHIYIIRQHKLTWQRQLPRCCCLKDYLLNLPKMAAESQQNCTECSNTVMTVITGARMATQIFMCLERDALQPVPKMAVQAVQTYQKRNRYKFLQGSSRMQTIIQLHTIQNHPRYEKHVIQKQLHTYVCAEPPFQWFPSLNKTACRLN